VRGLLLRGKNYNEQNFLNYLDQALTAETTERIVQAKLTIISKFHDKELFISLFSISALTQLKIQKPAKHLKNYSIPFLLKKSS
jgi:hypothetical protein